MSKMTFGFRNVNGAAFDIKIVEAPNGSFPDKNTILKLREFVIKRMNVRGRQAARLTKTEGWSPKLSGALIKSISWLEARASTATTDRVLTGALTVGVPYGRRQEFEHKSRGRYLGRALDAVFPELARDLEKRGALEDVLFSRRRQAGGDGVRGGSF